MCEQANWDVRVPVPPGADPVGTADAFAADNAALLVSPEFVSAVRSSTSLLSTAEVENSTVVSTVQSVFIPDPLTLAPTNAPANTPSEGEIFTPDPETEGEIFIPDPPTTAPTFVSVCLSYVPM
jgi:hypothetical protein